MNTHRRSFLTGLVALTAGTVLPRAGRAAAPAGAALPAIELWKNPGCGCCHLWEEHMREAGFAKVTTHEVFNLPQIRKAQGIPVKYASCHTARVAGYTLEGHVPAEDVKRLLKEKPNAVGLVVPGMPVGAPGMETKSGRRAAYDVLLVLKDGTTRVFSHYDAIAG